MTSPQFNMDDELARIAREEEETMQQLRAMEEKRRELQRQKLEIQAKKLTIPITVTIYRRLGAYVHFRTSDYREDVRNKISTLTGVTYKGNNEFALPIKYYEQIETLATNLPNVTVTYTEGTKENIDAYLNQPLYEIIMDSKGFVINVGEFGDIYKFEKILGAEKDWTKKRVRIPFTEGYRIAEVLQDVTGVVWAEDAKEFVVKQIESRKILAELRTKEDYELPKHFAQEHWEKNGIKARPFQNVGVAFALHNGGRALIADQMGLGKTIQAILYALVRRAQKPYYKVVVVCPASLKPNWGREITKFSGEKPLVMAGSVPSKYDIITMLKHPGTFIVMNYDMVGRKIEHKDEHTDENGHKHISDKKRYLWAEAINLIQADLVILDESHYIKNTDSNRSAAVRTLKSPEIIQLTGTPVLNRPGELWPLLTMLKPEMFPSEEQFIRQYTYDGKHARNVDQLQAALSTLMIRRLKKDVVKDLPPINRMFKYTELNERFQNVYDRVLEGVFNTIDRAGNEIQKSVPNILVQIQRLKQVCELAKREATADLATELNDSAKEAGEQYPKVIIFSQYVSAVRDLAARTSESGSVYFTGAQSPMERQNIVDKFQNDPSINILVASTKAAQEGLNITAAGHIIFHDLMWTPAAHEQAEARAYGRLSDCHSVDSYYMLCENTIDEEIYKLLEAKMRMITEVVEGAAQVKDDSILMALIQKLRENSFTRRKNS